MKWLLRIIGVVVALLVIAFLFLRTPDTDPAEMRAKYGGEPSQFVELDSGLVVHLRDEGPRDAPAIVLLHGSNADLLTWNPWVERLSDTYRIIRFDQPGHGLTGATPDEDYTIQTYVDTIDRVAGKLKLTRFTLGGNSMGGGHTLAYALQHPERLEAMILVDAGGPPRQKNDEDGTKGSGGNIGFTIAQTPGVRELMKHVTPRSMVEQSLRQSVTNQDIVTDEAVDRYWEMLRYPGNRAATIFRFSQTRVPFTEEQMASLDIPSLIIWGEEDAIIPLSAGEWLNTHLPNSELLVLPNIGHLPMEEAPNETAATVRSFMANLPETIETGAE
ncbi:alpha/beta hydrolase [Pontixanthobacter aestiaquae]|uniref:Alpha/beta fold hydrolase n=1 Tax=Pontixanthobacter aestiaquae TaxID=1509367 RepID=A0A844Z6G0_9SPHN|nr:alpha/beta hydrolase [Pontixanthobacter aestiaquae]MDN3645912.1 alpha/beta hydrolase [Pontixanthobacter aestiaquae]MXO83094.1 alpha/beta fold hydrolase [Pontixanthobacter aestiaquae]